jgi:GNAT superfamily N-acetyltransferase|tara:strand:+ start:59 stop:526 length:468 start_codon:yes stop_codon:yes gene_type:complete
MIDTKVTYSREVWGDLRDELEPMFKAHWEEIEVNREKVKLSPNWASYSAIEASGCLGVYTARKEGKMIGYCVVIADTSLHHSDHIFAFNDLLYIDPAHRKGMTGMKLIKYAESDLKECGVSYLVINTKVSHPFDPLLERLGFDLIERSYSKYLGD